MLQVRTGDSLRLTGMFRLSGVRTLQVLAVTLLMLVAIDVLAMRRIESGEAPKLAPDEGLVIFSVDTSARISNIHIDEVRGGTAVVLNYLDLGRTLNLYAGKVGEYEWSQVNLTTVNMRSRFGIGKPEFRFRILPGKITYPGDLVLRPDSLSTSYIQVHNRSLAALDWLEAEHGAVYRTLPFEYSGHYPDPFPAHYRAAREKSPRAATELNRARAVNRPKELTKAAEAMWQDDRVLAVALNPAGTLLVESLRDRNSEGVIDSRIELIDLATGTRHRLASNAPGALLWKDDHMLIATQAGGQTTVFQMTKGEDGTFSANAVPISGTGRVVDPLPLEPGVILFEGFDSRGSLVVHRVKLEGKTIRGFQTARSRDRLNQGVNSDLAWLTDGNGRLRAAIAVQDQDFVLLHGRDGAFEEVLRYREGFAPVGLSFDGQTIYVLTDEGRTQRDLVSFDPVSRKITGTLFSKPGADLVDVVLDARRNPVAARYYQYGRLVTEYFDEADRDLDKWMQSIFPGRTVAVIARSNDGNQLIVWVDSGNHPPQIHHLDAASRRGSLIDEVIPGLGKKTFAPAHVLKAHSTDGLQVEAFLTLPEAKGKRPVVVFPHGGPIGISDRLHFDREVQYLASLGYAVLQVNFRGSEGYGKAFRAAGERNYGRLIEDDIDAAVRAAIAAHPLDESRMCVLGSSYGGYSALISAIRWPDRFRCAVSLSGVSDRLLFFTASDSARSEKMRPILERLMGNPLVDMDEMQQTSPLYHAQKLTLPVMLVHGREDKRVDFEHTRRLVRMLNLEGRPPVVLAPRNLGHGLDSAFHAVVAWSAIADFLQQNLGTTPAESSGSRETFSLAP